MQQVDSELAQLQHRRKNLPEQAEFLSLRGRHEEINEDLVAARTRSADLELEQAKAESDLAPVRERKARNEKRIADGSVADPKALSTMIEEVEHLTRRISDLEDAELEVMQAAEESAATCTTLQTSADEIAGQLTEVKQRRDQAVRAIDADIADRNTRRGSIAAELPEALVNLYDRVRASHSGIGAAGLVRRRCTGCQLDVNAADLRSYAAAPADEVLRCEECGRILVRTEDSGI
ncbi:zinc ribbon domain-containing protein [Propionibacteriaceae bacterium Y1685]